MTIKINTAVLVMAMSMLAATVHADHQKEMNAGSFSRQDYKFVTEAACGGLMEVQAGQLAATKGVDPAVRAFGKRMVTDHTKANDELKLLATKKNATLPTDLGKEQKKLAELQNVSGTDFDRVYSKMMLKDHEKDVKEFRKEAAGADDPDLKDFAAKTLPVLEEHLGMARSLGTNVKGK